MSRLRGLFAAGLVDSFGLALGWTVFVLHAADVGGLGLAGALSAAMLGGVALSAPATTWLSGRVDGGALLRLATLSEIILRPCSFALLIGGAPVAVVAGAVCLAHVAGWTGYAGMRAEVAAVDARPATMTAYVVGVAAVEALGAATAALLPAGPGAPSQLVVVVAALYGGCLLPTLLIARGARVQRSTSALGAALRPSAPALGGALALTALAAGPTLLSAALALELHGRSAVALAAVAFTAGALLAPALAGRLDRRGLRPAVAWPALAVGMVAGWALAPLHVAGLALAQVLAGMCMSAMEGDMDGRLARRHGDGSAATAALAWAAAARAFGGSIAVGLAPVLLAAVTLGALSAVLAAALVAATLGAWVLSARPAKVQSAPGRGAHMGGPGLEPGTSC